MRSISRALSNGRESRHKNAKRASGGFLVLVKQHLNQYISVEQTNQYVVWLSFKSHPIIYIGFVYIPPIGTTSTRDTCPFDDLQDEIVSKRCTGQVYISGDFNSRTAEIRDIDMYRDFPGNMLLCKHRLNNDKVTNTYGRKLIDLCRSNEMAILNGRVRIGGNLNRSNCYTCIRYNGSSVVDYVIAQIEALKIMTHFEVLEKLVESDHTPLSLTLEVVLDKPRTEQRRERDVPYYYKWNPGNKQAFLEAFNATVTQNFYQEILCAVADGKTKSDGIIDLFYDMILTYRTISRKSETTSRKISRVTIGLMTNVSSKNRCWNQTSWAPRIDRSYNDNTKVPYNVRSETITKN